MRKVAALWLREAHGYLTPVLCLVLSIWLSGCHRLPRFQTPRETALAVDSQAECAEIVRKSPALLSFRALANTTVTYAEADTSFRYVMLSKGTDKFRIDLLPEGGSYTIGMLVVDGEQTTVLDSQAKTFARSGDEQKLVKSFLGLEGITRQVVLGLLSGYLPPLSCDEVRVYHLDSGYMLADTTHRLVWEIERETFGVSRMLALNESQDRVIVEGRRVVTGQNGELSILLEVHSPAQLKVVIQPERVGINPTVSDALFQIAIPADYTDVSE